MATVVECLWASETCAECMKRDECRDEKRVAMLRSERDAARRAGKAEGIKIACGYLKTRSEMGWLAKYPEVAEELRFCIDALLARAKEVERE